MYSALEDISPRLQKVTLQQIRRDPWPDFASFSADRYDSKLRLQGAHQWLRRAREEYGSVREFSELIVALSALRAPVTMLGTLSRIVTDEVRHAHLCAEMARVLCPDGFPEDQFEWAPPEDPWQCMPERQGFGDAHGNYEQALMAWVCEVIICASCIGESLSKPLLDATAMVSTDPVVRSVQAQILRDEQLHAVFGFEVLAYFLPKLSPLHRRWIDSQLAHYFASFERGAVGNEDIHTLADTELVLEEAGPNDPPNLGMLTGHQYLMIFYASMESLIFPEFTKVGLDPVRAWQRRHEATYQNVPSGL